MKPFLILSFAFFTLTCSAQVNPRHTKVRQYKKKDGRVVRSHERTRANRTQRDNYSAKGNVNPYTGERGGKRAKK